MLESINEMTIGEIEKSLRARRRLAKKAPKLRKERDEILARLKTIDKQLAVAGPVRGQKPGKKTAKRAVKRAVAKKAVTKTVTKAVTKKAVKKTVAKKTVRKKAAAKKTKATRQPAKKAAAKTRKSGMSVKQRVLDFLGASKDLHKAAEIRKAFPDVKPGYIFNTLNRLKKAGEVIHENGKWGVKLPF